MKTIIKTLAFSLIGLSSITACNTDANLSLSPSDPDILYMGRTVVDDSLGVLFNYPGVTAMFNFEGRGLEMSAKPGSRFFMVTIDDDKPFKIDFNDSISTILLADSLAAGPHSARIVYAVEGHELQPAIRGFEILGPGARILPAPERPELKIEFIGNSITCGYGLEADSAQVHFAFDNENHILSYAYLTARELDADFNVVARSGIGMYRSYGGDRMGTPGNRMPDVYDRTLYYDPDSEWDHSRFEPDIICINLGTNDTSLNDFEISLFEEYYNRFVDHLRQLHPNAKIVLTVGPMLTGELLETMTAAHDRIAADCDNVYRFDYTPCDGSLGYGADWHPSRRQARLMASELVPFLRQISNP